MCIPNWQGYHGLCTSHGLSVQKQHPQKHILLHCYVYQQRTQNYQHTSGLNLTFYTIVSGQVSMKSMKLVILLHFISWKNSFSDISRKCSLPDMIRPVNWQKTPNNAVTLHRQSQFTPKMKANAVPRLLSSLVWIDQYNKCNRMTSFMEFM